MKMLSKELRLRFANTADAYRIAVLSRDLIEAGLGWSWTPARVLRGIRRSDTLVLVVTAGDRLAGFAVMYYGADTAHLNLLAVDGKYQRLGLGRRLLRWLEESAEVAGITTVFLEVRASSVGAQVFYRKLGYNCLEQLPGYYLGRESAIRMARNLRPFLFRP